MLPPPSYFIDLTFPTNCGAAQFLARIQKIQTFQLFFLLHPSNHIGSANQKSVLTWCCRLFFPSVCSLVSRNGFHANWGPILQWRDPEVPRPGTGIKSCRKYHGARRRTSGASSQRGFGDGTREERALVYWQHRLRDNLVTISHI